MPHRPIKSWLRKLIPSRWGKIFTYIFSLRIISKSNYENILRETRILQDANQEKKLIINSYLVYCYDENAQVEFNQFNHTFFPKPRQALAEGLQQSMQPLFVYQMMSD